jgi:hypothetical protein
MDVERAGSGISPARLAAPADGGPSILPLQEKRPMAKPKGRGSPKS